MRWLRVIAARARGIFRRESVIRDIERELRAHVELETEANRARGMSPVEARRAALRSFGNFDRVRDAAYEIRGGGMLETWTRDVRLGLRRIYRNPGFTLIAVLSLALGIGANTAIFSVVNAVLLRPLPYEEPERLVLMYEDAVDVANRWVSYPNFLDWRARSRSFEAMSVIRGWQLTLTGDGEPEHVNARMVSAAYFDVMRAQPTLGRAFLPEEDTPGAEPVTVISHGFWQRRFGGDPGAVGRTVELDGQPYRVVGVMPEGFQHHGPPPLWVLVGQWTGRDNWMQRDVRVAGNVIARLRPGVTVEQARADMASVKQALVVEHAWTNAGHEIRVTPLHESIVSEDGPVLLILLGAVGCVLLIACANVASLLLARATTRRKEFAVRAALGAGRWRLMRQLLVESVLLAALGGAAGLLLAWWGLGLLRAAEPAGLPRVGGAGLYPRVLWFTCSLSLLTGVLFGLVPAWQASRMGLAGALKEGARSTAGGTVGKLRGGLVVVEVALALVLLVGAGLLTKSLARLLETDPGFDPRHVLTMTLTLPRQRYEGKAEMSRFQRQLLERVAALPGVEGASLSNAVPGLGDAWQTDIGVEGHYARNPGEEINVDWTIASEDYFRVMKLPLLAGRPFTEQEAREGLPVVVVDESLARRFWPGGDAVGQYLKYDSRTPHEVVGVVPAIRRYGSETPGRIHLYTPLGRANPRTMTLSLRADEARSGDLAAAVAAAVRAIDKDLPVYDVATLEQDFRRVVAPRKFNLALLGLFAAIALALASVGIYGVVSFSVAQRTHELGVRIALGARPRDVLRLVLRRGMALVLCGVGVGLAGSLALTRMMSGLLYGVSADDPFTFGAIALVLVGVSLVACYIPARRATRVDPLVALRSE